MKNARRVESKHRLVNWWGKHQRALGLIGALIVFLTFIFKEALRDHVKDRADTVASAESAFRRSKDTELLRIQLFRIERKVDTVERDIPQKDASNDDSNSNDSVDAQRGQMLKDSLRTIDDSLQNTSRLLTALPHEESAIAALRLLQKEFQDYHLSFGRVSTRVLMDLNENDEISKSTTKAVDELVDAGIALSGKTDALAASALAFAETQSNANRKLLSECTGISYVLYGKGWGIGILSKIFGTGNAVTE